MSSSRAYGALALAGSLWGTGFLFGKLVLPELTVAHLILYRLLFACAGPCSVFDVSTLNPGGDVCGRVAPPPSCTKTCVVS